MGTTDIVSRVASSFKKKVKSELSNRLKSFYVVGSYAFGKISKQRPDINFLLIFDGFTSPDDYLAIGEICRDLEKEFAKETTVKIEFRPFRYIKPRYKNDTEVSVNPILISTGEIEATGGVIFNKWFTEGLKSAHKLLHGKDFLKSLKVGDITQKDLIKGAMFDLMFFSIPVSRAPAQYTKEETNLLLNEALVNAKNMAYLGIETAMTDKELKQKDYLKYFKNKETIASFYKERYGNDVEKMIKRIFQVRKQYLTLKDDPEVGKEMFSIALNLANIIRDKIFSKVVPDKVY